MPDFPPPSVNNPRRRASSTRPQNNVTHLKTLRMPHLSEIMPLCMTSRYLNETFHIVWGDVREEDGRGDGLRVHTESPDALPPLKHPDHETLAVVHSEVGASIRKYDWKNDGFVQPKISSMKRHRVVPPG